MTGDANRNRLVAFGPELVLAGCPSHAPAHGAASFRRENPHRGAFQADTRTRDGRREMRLCQISKGRCRVQGRILLLCREKGLS